LGLALCRAPIQGADWDEDIAKGLLHSTIYCPILSFGTTAPMAPFPEAARAQLIAVGWEEAPLGLARLCGAEQDREDALLKEMIIASALLERSPESGAPLGGEGGQLRAAFPIFAGRPQPPGHPAYPPGRGEGEAGQLAKRPWRLAARPRPRDPPPRPFPC
jgi:hypothetical protein